MIYRHRIEHLLLLGLLLFYVPHFIVGAVTPYFWPVVSIFTPMEVKEIGSRTILVKGTATRYRGRCSWVTTDWFLGNSRKEYVPVTISYLDDPQVRDEGTMTWEGMIIGLSKNDFIHNSYAVAKYRCWHWWPYNEMITTNLFYEGRGQDAKTLETDVSQDYLLKEQQSLGREINILKRQLEAVKP